MTAPQPDEMRLSENERQALVRLTEWAQDATSHRTSDCVGECKLCSDVADLLGALEGHSLGSPPAPARPFTAEAVAREMVRVENEDDNPGMRTAEARALRLKSAGWRAEEVLAACARLSASCEDRSSG